jgi:AcrR family transcriptional regulator
MSAAASEFIRMTNVKAPARDRYHHGNLREALIDAGMELAREGGPDAVIVREASRRVGVSHNAAYRHFPDREALLRAVGERCMRRLAQIMQELIAEVDPSDGSIEAATARLRATGLAYVRFALDEPGLFRTGFAAAGDSAVQASGRRVIHEGEAGGVGAHEPPHDAVDPGPLELLQAQLDGLVSAGGMPAELRPYAEFAAWSAVHGFSMLLLDGPLRDLPESERQAALERTLDTIQRGLSSTVAVD